MTAKKRKNLLWGLLRGLGFKKEASCLGDTVSTVPEYDK